MRVPPGANNIRLSSKATREYARPRCSSGWRSSCSPHTAETRQSRTLSRMARPKSVQPPQRRLHSDATDTWWPFDPANPDGGGPLKIGDYVEVVGTLWQDGGHPPDSSRRLAPVARADCTLF